MNPTDYNSKKYAFILLCCGICWVLNSRLFIPVCLTLLVCFDQLESNNPLSYKIPTIIVSLLLIYLTYSTNWGIILLITVYALVKIVELVNK